jgi:hypothetical protein
MVPTRIVQSSKHNPEKYRMEIEQLVPNDQFDAAIEVRVVGRDGSKTSVTIWPVAISTTSASGLADWEDRRPEPPFVVEAKREGSVWGQRLLLASTAIHQREPTASALRINHWAVANLDVPDLLGPLGSKVRLELDSRTWKAHLEVDTQPELKRSQGIPAAMRNLELSELLVEVFAQVFLGYSWHTFELNSSGLLEPYTT